MNNANFIINLTLFLIFSFLAYIIIIPLFKKKKITQTVRLDGPKEHYKKNKTPILGGIVIVCGSLLSFIILLSKNPFKAELSYIKIIIIFISIMGYFLLGLIDDTKIIKKKNNEGLSIKRKFIGELVIAAAIFFALLSFKNNKQISIINIFGLQVNLYGLYGCFLIFYLMSYTNAVNFTDGIDGLAGGVSLIIAITLTLIAHQKSDYTVFYFGISLIIQLIVFLFFNLNKALIFMGDTGSLAIGASLAIMAVLLKVEILLFVMGFVFFLEALSVVIQIIVFKKYHRRIFLMAPLHHHLELKGFNEWQIDFIGWGITLFFCLLCLFWEGIL